ncbi:DUF2149 domain-containing protein [Roseimaritima ulvae]|uniref:DUF2149 domain-containing protein n=1 Tax=Roseimaritima ulvae TaxID=980254 RepID=A0A5B9QGK4_9BACT|nr:DUF2149 domain-containing protein [Roseimaritima ulvae]QEG38207.1 hypothetical protein UC8_01610 [Roseimaritima ulvae]
MASRKLRILDEDDSDPILSSVNLVDVFLVAMVMLMVAVASHPLAQLADEDFTVLRDAGRPTMEILIKRGEKLTRFQATGSSTEGNGMKAGTAYRMQDGSMVYVPHDIDTAEESSQP